MTSKEATDNGKPRGCELAVTDQKTLIKKADSPGNGPYRSRTDTSLRKMDFESIDPKAQPVDPSRLCEILSTYSASFLAHLSRECPELPDLIKIYPVISGFTLGDLIALADETPPGLRVAPQPFKAEVKS